MLDDLGICEEEAGCNAESGVLAAEWCGQHSEIGELLRCRRRLRAFQGVQEAEKFAAREMAQEALDALGVVEGGSSGDEEQPQQPEGLCFLLRRTRAFLGAGAAEELADKLVEKDSQRNPAVKATVALAPMPALLAQSDRRLTLPSGSTRRCLTPSRGSPRDPLDQVATPNRKRMSRGAVGASPGHGGA